MSASSAMKRNKSKTLRGKVETDNNTIIDLEKTADNIRRKFRSIRNQESSRNDYYVQRYKPIVEPLTTALHKISLPPVSDIHKKEEKEEGNKNIKQEKKEFIPNQIQLDTSDQDSIEQYLNTHTGPITRKYIKQIIVDPNNIIDKRYGVRRIGNDFKIGDSHMLLTNEDDVIIKNKQYKVTPGLAQLLFLNNPNKNEYTVEDLKNYKAIVLDTNAHREKYLPLGNIMKNRSYKYKNIIKYTESQPVTGKGGTNLIQVSRNPIDLKYWNDPNELVQRLYLLHSSRAIGHTGLDSEIASIEEELREENLIE